MTTEERAKKAAYMREYTLQNNAKINSQRRARRAQDRDRTLHREKLWRARNRAKVLLYKKSDREKRPDDYRKWKRQWAQVHAVEIRERRSAEYKEKKFEIKERLLRFQKQHPERFKKQRCASSQRRRARLAGVPQEPIDRDQIYDRDGGICGLCHRRVSRKYFSLDHILPLIKGGPHIASNLQLAHVNCNKRRGAKGPAQMRLDLSLKPSPRPERHEFQMQ